MNTKHPHAELMMLYAQDAMETDKPWERWELQWQGKTEWETLDMHPRWFTENKYRRKPRTIVINGHEVPEPVREVPSICTRYWTVHTLGSNLVYGSAWENGEFDRLALSRGLIHLTKEAAEAHAKALLSFTATE